MTTPGDQTNGAPSEEASSAGPGAVGGEGAAADPKASRGKWLGRAAALLLIVAALSAVAAAMAGFGSRWGFWHFRTGFGLLRWAAYVAIAVAVLSLPVLWLARPGQKRSRALVLSLLALLLSAPVFLIPLGWRMQAGDVPPIHDITTDTNDPPRFEAIVPLRADAPNPVEYPGAEVAEQQEEAYPDIRPAVLDIPAGRAYERALATARDMGWKIVEADPEEGRIEATDRTFWFGFTDDVVIRLTPSGERTIVDVRSKSRVGRSDVGTNARRIRSYLDRLTS